MKTEKIEVCDFFDLEDLIGRFKSKVPEFTEKDYKDVGIEKDYTPCWYEGDEPGIKAVWTRKI